MRRLAGRRLYEKIATWRLPNCLNWAVRFRPEGEAEVLETRD
jgi:hypothetical protein